MPRIAPRGRDRKAGCAEESPPAYRWAAELDAGNARVWVELAKALAEAGRSRGGEEARDKAFGCR